MKTRLKTSVVSLGLLMMSVSLFGCPKDEDCQFLNDCPSGNQCLDGTCQPVGSGDGGIVIIGEGEGEGEGERPVNEIDDGVIQTGGPLPFVERDPRDPTRGIFTEYDGNIDRVRAFDLASGRIVEGAELDFVDSGLPCNFDSLMVNDEAVDRELWVTCKVESTPFITYGGEGEGEEEETFQSRIYYANEDGQFNLGEFVVEVGTSAQTTLKLPQTGQDPGNSPRIISTDRGGNRLTSLQIRNEDRAKDQRQRDTFVGLTFESIDRLVPMVTEPDRSGMIVIDRGETPKLIPLERLFDQEEWIANPEALPEVELPEGAWAVIFTEPIDSIGSQTDDYNTMIVFPKETSLSEEGQLVVGFYLYNAAGLNQVVTEEVGQLGFAFDPIDPKKRQYLNIESDALSFISKGEPQERLFRIPFDSVQAASVLFSDYQTSPLAKGNGVVGSPTDGYWISYAEGPNLPLIERLRLAP